MTVSLAESCTTPFLFVCLFYSQNHFLLLRPPVQTGTLADKLLSICGFCTAKGQKDMTLTDIICISADVYRDLEFPQCKCTTVSLDLPPPTHQFTLFLSFFLSFAVGLQDVLDLLNDNDVTPTPIIMKCYQNTKFKSHIVKLAFEKFFQARNVAVPPPPQ